MENRAARFVVCGSLLQCGVLSAAFSKINDDAGFGGGGSRGSGRRPAKGGDTRWDSPQSC